MAALVSNEYWAGTANIQYGKQSGIVRRANGDMWVAVQGWNTSFNGSSETHLFCSKDNGNTWTQRDVLAEAYPNGTDSRPGLFIDKDDYIHEVMYLAGSPQPAGFYHRRGSFSSDGNTINWGPFTAIATYNFANQNSFSEVVAHRDPAGSGGWHVHIVWGGEGNNGTYGAGVYYNRILIDVNGNKAVTYSTSAPLTIQTYGGVSPYGAGAHGTIDFEHIGDGLTVKNGTPHIWIATTGMMGNSTLQYAFVKKLTYNAGNWTPETLKAITSAGVGAYYSLWGRYDGTRFSVAGQEQLGTSNYLVVYDMSTDGQSVTRNPLATFAQASFGSGVGTTTSGGGDPHQQTSVIRLPGGDFVFVGVDSTSSSTTKVNYRKWTRSTNTLGAITLLMGATNQIKGPHAVIRYGAATDVIVQTYNSAGPYYSDYYAAYVGFNNPTPTAVGPANGASVNVGNPTLSVTFAAGPSQKGEWQLATDAGFTTNVKSVIEADSDVVTGPATNTEPLPAVSKLAQGTWYVRARSETTGGALQSGWTTANTFTVSHPPSATSLSPTAGQYIAYGVGNVTFAWQFSSTEPTSTQTAYQIIVERSSDGALIYDTGKVTSAATTREINIPAGYKDIDLRWRIRLWDEDNIVGNYSSNQIFKIGDGPTVNITAPAEGGTVNVNNPQAQWTFVAPGGRIQSSFHVVYTRTADGLVLHDSGTIAGAATSYTPPGFVVDNDTEHTVTVTVTDSGGIQGTDSNNFTTSWIPPDQPIFTVDVSQFASAGFVLIQWDDSLKDPAFYSWRIYRKLSTSALWTLVDELFVDNPVNTYHDYLAATNQPQDWAVVQVVTRFGTHVESTRNEDSATPLDDHYWIVQANNSDGVNLRLAHVTADSFSDQYESQEVHLLGRGRHFEYGDRLGYSGSLSAELRDNSQFTARAQRLLLEQMKMNQAAVWVRNPFGDVWHISAGDLSLERTPGVGVSEFASLTMPYTEVSD